MRKLRFIFAFALLFLTACNSSPETPDTEKITSIETETIKETETTKETETETVKETEVETVKETEVAQEPTKETFHNMTFMLSPEWTFKQSSETLAVLTFEPQKRVMTITAVNLTDVGQERGEQDGLLRSLGLESTLSGFSDVQLRQDFNISIDGETATGTVASVLLSDAWYSATVLSVLSDGYQYNITYMIITDSSDTEHTDYEDFMNSIVFE
jgi:hypothetical protein